LLIDLTISGSGILAHRPNPMAANRRDRKG
jgi:hypothetical protein